MIPGRFGNTTGRPYVSGRLLLPRLQLRTNLSFLVDTGADCSTLMPASAIKMGLNYAALTDMTTVGGVGGDTDCFREEAIIAFNEPNRNLIRYYVITLLILAPDPALMNMPSLLGRDILDQWYMHYDASSNRLTFTVKSASYTHKIS